LARPVNPTSYESVDPRSAGSTWTGGQYSLVRALFGAWLLFGALRLLPWEARFEELPFVYPPDHSSSVLDSFVNVFWWNREPWVVTSALAICAIASVLFAAGSFHRIAAAVLAYVWSCFATSFPLAPTPGVPWIVVLLLAHLTLPPAPYGSWVARGRPDPEGAWRIHLPVFQLAWAMLLLGCIIDVFDRLGDDPWRRQGGGWQALSWIGIACEAAVPLGVFKRRTRAIAWSAAFLWRLLVLVLGGADDRLRGMLIVHLYSFDPLWLQPLRARTREHLFFDGECGLCHRMVRFVAAEDRGSAFFYSPLQGNAIKELVPEEARARLPDSIVIRADDGRLLICSDAAIHALRRVGGAWRALGELLAVVPRPVRDFGYRVVARVRKRLFTKPDGSCPLLSTRLRTYFLP